MAKQIAKESAMELMRRARRTTIVSGAKSAITGLYNLFKKKWKIKDMKFFI